MARDFEDLHDLDDLSDDELRELVRTHLAANNSIDANDIVVHVEDGVVRLAGRVGTESERRVAEHVVTDVLGLEQVENELLVGDRAPPLNPETEHLVDDLDARLYGTTDVQNAIERGTAWIPPTSPTPEGLSGTDAEGSDLGEDH